MNKPSTIIHVYCMDCKEFIGTKEGYGIEGISHGLCDECFRARMLAIEMLKEEMHRNPELQEAL